MEGRSSGAWRRHRGEADPASLVGESVREHGAWMARSERSRQDVDQLAALARSELDLAWRGREQRVVAAAADVLAGVELGAPLTDDDRPGQHLGAVEHLHAQPLGGRVTAVAGG